MFNTHLVSSEAESALCELGPGLLTHHSRSTMGPTDGVTWQHPDDNGRIQDSQTWFFHFLQLLKIQALQSIHCSLKKDSVEHEPLT